MATADALARGSRGNGCCARDAECTEETEIDMDAAMALMVDALLRDDTDGLWWCCHCGECACECCESCALVDEEAADAAETQIGSSPRQHISGLQASERRVWRCTTMRRIRRRKWQRAHSRCADEMRTPATDCAAAGSRHRRRDAQPSRIESSSSDDGGISSGSSDGDARSERIVWCGNVPEGVPLEMFAEMLAERSRGRVLTVSDRRTRRGRCAFAEYSDARSASEAIRDIDGLLVDARTARPSASSDATKRAAGSRRASRTMAAAAAASDECRAIRLIARPYRMRCAEQLAAATATAATGSGSVSCAMNK